MILATSAIIKILLLLAVLLLEYCLFRKKLQKKTLVALGALTLVCAFAANGAAKMVPPLTDTITLTAMGQGREEAKGTEIFLRGYTIDGEKSLALEDLQISDGHWYWHGNMYCWRPESDERQPDGVTESVELKIPVGWNRTLNFQSAIYRGEVQIETAENTWVIDTYSEENGEIAAQIGRSSTASLIWNQILRLEVYTALLAIYFGVTLLILRKVRYPSPKFKSWISRHNGKLVYAGISLFISAFMFHYASKSSFWLDELLQIAFSNGSIWDSIQYCVKMRDATPPLFTVFAAIWYHIVPYGEQWLLLLPIIFTAMTVYLMGIIGEKLRGKYYGVIAAIFTGFSVTIWENVAYEYRPYSFMVFFSSLTFYFYICRNQKSYSSRLNWGYALSMTALAMSHYFGMLACVVFFVSDMFLIFKKKLSWKKCLLYLIPGIISAVWIVYIYFSTLRYQSMESIATRPVPTISRIQSLLKFLSGNFELSYWLLIFGVAIVISRILSNKVSNINHFYGGFSCVMIIFVISVIYIYGNFINTKATMWTNRYFLLLIPYVTVVSIQTADCFLNLFTGKQFLFINRSICMFISLAFSINCLSNVSQLTSNEPYREAADWIYTQGNYIFNSNTTILFTASDEAMEAWTEYYVEMQGRRDPLNVIQQSSFTLEDVEAYDRIYVNYNHTAISSELQQLLNEYYSLEQNNTNVNVSVYVRK